MQNRFRSVPTDELRPHVCTLCYFHDKLAPLAKFNSTTEDRNEATWGGDEGDTETRPLVTRHSSAIGTRSPTEEAPPSLTERGEVGQKQTPAVTGARMSTGEISRYLAKLARKCSVNVQEILRNPDQHPLAQVICAPVSPLTR